MPSYHHCLYPTFTKHLYKLLISERQSINLYGEIGQGRSRILEDLTIILEQENIQVVNIDMKACVKDFQHFLDALNDAITVMGRDGDLAMWINGVEQSNKPTALFLDNFDVLFGDFSIYKMHQIETQFVTKINGIKNTNNIHLLCATTKPHEKQIYYLNSEIGTSPFILKEEGAPIGLSTKKVRAELNQKLNTCKDWQVCTDKEKGFYAVKISKHNKPYLLLEYIVKQIKNVGIEPKTKRRQLQYWIKVFDHNQQVDWFTYILEWKQKKRRNFKKVGCTYQLLKGILLFVLGILFIYFFVNENTLGAGITGIGSVVLIVTFLNQVLGLLNNLFKK